MKKWLLLLACFIPNCARFQRVFGQAELQLSGKSLRYCQEDFEKKVKGCVYASEAEGQLCVDVYTQQAGSEQWTLSDRACFTQEESEHSTQEL